MKLTKEEITNILSEKSEYLAEAYGVKRIGLFGSYAKGTYTEHTLKPAILTLSSNLKRH